MAKRHRYAAALPLAIVLLAGAVPRTLSDEQLVVLARKSTFVFRGTIETLKASTLSIPTEGRTAVVRVDEILDAPSDLRSLGGKQVTVRLLTPAQEKERTSRIFFTDPYSFGRTLGVTETGSLAGGDSGALRDRLVKARQRIADDALAERLRLALNVVVARVVRVAPAPEYLRGRGIEDSEHNPEWYVAILTVSKSLKGAASPQLEVRFASSRDVMWFGTPKLKPEQEAIFLIQRNVMKEFPTRGPIVIDPLDVQNTSQQARIERLLAAQR